MHHDINLFFFKIVNQQPCNVLGKGFLKRTVLYVHMLTGTCYHHHIYVTGTLKNLGRILVYKKV